MKIKELKTICPMCGGKKVIIHELSDKITCAECGFQFTKTNEAEETEEFENPRAKIIEVEVR